MHHTVFGKILLFGGYAILEPGNVGLVLCIDKGLHFSVQKRSDSNIIVRSPQYAIAAVGKYDGNTACFSEKDPSFLFIEQATAYSITYLQYKKIDITGFELDIRTDDALLMKNKKTGFGSSAAVTVGVVQSVLGCFGITDKDVISKIALYAHFKSQGKVGSGFDISASCFGGHFFTSSRIHIEGGFEEFLGADLGITRELYTWPKYFVPVVAFSGVSASTPNLVKKVLAYKEQNTDAYDGFMVEYNAINMALKHAFLHNEKDNIVLLLEQSWKKRKELGIKSGVSIESDTHTKLFSELTHHGAIICGLPGGGGGDSFVCLCENNAAKEEVSRYLRDHGFDIVDVTMQ